MGDVRLELEDGLNEPAPGRAPERHAGVALLAFCFILGTALGIVVGRRTTTISSDKSTIGRFSLELASGTHLDLHDKVSVAISPDGKTIAFIANAEDGGPASIRP